MIMTFLPQHARLLQKLQSTTLLYSNTLHHILSFNFSWQGEKGERGTPGSPGSPGYNISTAAKVSDPYAINKNPRYTRTIYTWYKVFESDISTDNLSISKINSTYDANRCLHLSAKSTLSNKIFTIIHITRLNENFTGVHISEFLLYKFWRSSTKF